MFDDDDMLLDDDMDSIMKEMTDDDFEPTVNIQNRNSNNQILSNQLANGNPYNGSHLINSGQNVKTSNNQNDFGLENRGQMRSSSSSYNQKPEFGSNAASVLTSEELVAMEFEDDLDFPPEDFITSPTNTSKQSTNQNMNNTANRGTSAKNSKIKDVGEGLVNNVVKHENREPKSQINTNRQVNTNETDFKSSVTIATGSRQPVLNNFDRTVNIPNKGVNLSVESQNQISKFGTANQGKRKTDSASKLGLSKIKTEHDRKVGGTDSSAAGDKPCQRSIQSFFTPNNQESVQSLKEEKVDKSRQHTSLQSQKEINGTGRISDVI